MAVYTPYKSSGRFRGRQKLFVFSDLGGLYGGLDESTKRPVEICTLPMLSRSVERVSRACRWGLVGLALACVYLWVDGSKERRAGHAAPAAPHLTHPPPFWGRYDRANNHPQHTGPPTSHPSILTAVNSPQSEMRMSRLYVSPPTHLASLSGVCVCVFGCI